jgi:hypothetical protein
MIRAIFAPKLSLATRAAQVFAMLLTRGDKNFQRYFLSAVKSTLEKWAGVFRIGGPKKADSAKTGRKATAEQPPSLCLKRVELLFKPPAVLLRV